MNKLWSAPDDENDLPEWMRPETYRNPKPRARSGLSLNEAILQAVRRPTPPGWETATLAELQSMNKDDPGKD